MSTSCISKYTQSMYTISTHTSGQIYRQSMILESADIKFSCVRKITHGDKKGHIHYFFLYLMCVYVC